MRAQEKLKFEHANQISNIGGVPFSLSGLHGSVHHGPVVFHTVSHLGTIILSSFHSWQVGHGACNIFLVFKLILQI